MRTIKKRTQFKKDVKKAIKNPRVNIEGLKTAIDLLADEGELPQQYLPHPLIGNWKPSWECHIDPDFLLLYEINDTELHLIRCGSHSELFG